MMKEDQVATTKRGGSLPKCDQEEAHKSIKLNNIILSSSKFVCREDGTRAYIDEAQTTLRKESVHK